jgi:hypothetical protein
MGWLPWGSSEQEGGVKKTSGGAFESPSRTNRAKCYEARDAFFECLDRNKILDSVNSKAGVTASRAACGPEDQVFEKNCAHSWVCRTQISSSGEDLVFRSHFRRDANAYVLGGILQETASRQLPKGANNQADRSTGRRNCPHRSTTTAPSTRMRRMYMRCIETLINKSPSRGCTICILPNRRSHILGPGCNPITNTKTMRFHPCFADLSSPPCSVAKVAIVSVKGVDPCTLCFLRVVIFKISPKKHLHQASRMSSSFLANISNALL